MAPREPLQRPLALDLDLIEKREQFESPAIAVADLEAEGSAVPFAPAAVVPVVPSSSSEKDSRGPRQQQYLSSPTKIAGESPALPELCPVGAFGMDSLAKKSSAKTAAGAGGDEDTAGRGPAWIHSSQADVICATLIGLNAVYLAIETEVRTGVNQEDLIWFWTDSGFNLVFLLELLLRVMAERRRWGYDPWNVFDALLVLMGIVDTWIVPLAGAGAESNMRVMTLMRVFRLLRLARVLRLLRLVRFMKELSLLVHGVKGAMRAMIWGLLLIVITIFICGIFLTRLVGKDCCGDGNTFSNPNYAEWFGSLPLTAFTLFQFTMEFQADIARETFADGPWLALFLLGYVMFTSITLLNTVASVIVDNILSISQSAERTAREEEEKALRAEGQRLGKMFESLDADGDGRLTWEELGGQDGVLSLELRQVLQAAGISPEEAKDLFQIMDVSGDGSVSREEFVEGALRMRGAPQSKHVLGLERKVAAVDRKVDRLTDGLADVTQALVELRAAVQAQNSGHTGAGAVGLAAYARSSVVQPKQQQRAWGLEETSSASASESESGPEAAGQPSSRAPRNIPMVANVNNSNNNTAQHQQRQRQQQQQERMELVVGTTDYPRGTLQQASWLAGGGGGAATRVVLPQLQPPCSPQKRRPGERRRMEQQPQVSPSLVAQQLGSSLSPGSSPESPSKQPHAGESRPAVEQQQQHQQEAPLRRFSRGAPRSPTAAGVERVSEGGGSGAAATLEPPAQQQQQQQQHEYQIFSEPPADAGGGPSAAAASQAPRFGNAQAPEAVPGCLPCTEEEDLLLV